jgi:hypothetical protein
MIVIVDRNSKLFACNMNNCPDSRLLSSKLVKIILYSLLAWFFGYSPHISYANTPTQTVTPTIEKTQVARADHDEFSYGKSDTMEELIYYAIFSIGYLTLIRFGFNLHRFFSFFLLSMIFLLGLGVTFMIGLPGGLFVVIMGTFMVMMM